MNRKKRRFNHKTLRMFLQTLTEQPQQSCTCSVTCNSNMQCNDHLPLHHNDFISSWQWMEVNVIHTEFEVTRPAITGKTQQWNWLAQQNTKGKEVTKESKRERATSKDEKPRKNQTRKEERRESKENFIFWGKRGLCQTPHPGLSSPQNNDFGTSKGGNIKQKSFPSRKKKLWVNSRETLKTNLD